MGDGLLLEFPSVVDATQCMIEIQQTMAERNEAVDEDKRIVFRIGVHLGDLVVEGDDIFGDGINVAARLEAFCEAGGVAISGTAHENIAGRIDDEFVDTGDQKLKNISRPVRVW
jgi:class 3 adenylate cyclase